MATVVMMAKAPVAGQVKTRLCPPCTPMQAAVLAASFAKDTWATICSSSARAVLAYEGQQTAFDAPLCGADGFAQQGEDLGARIEHAAETALADAEQVLIVGSDLPGLRAQHLRQAEEAQSDVVLGPSDDGGYYLIGFRRFRPGCLANVRWSSSHALADSKKALTLSGLSVGEIRPFRDIDSPADLEQLRRALAAGTVRAPHTAQALAAIGPFDHHTGSQ